MSNVLIVVRYNVDGTVRKSQFYILQPRTFTPYFALQTPLLQLQAHKQYSLTAPETSSGEIPELKREKNTPTRTSASLRWDSKQLENIRKPSWKSGEMSFELWNYILETQSKSDTISFKWNGLTSKISHLLIWKEHTCGKYFSRHFKKVKKKQQHK